MNERIAKLYDQATILEGNGDYVAGELDFVKFAELIVNECVQICKTVGSDEVSNASKDYLEGREMGIEVCCNMIKKHFGVE
jgi:hypothetical protein